MKLKSIIIFSTIFIIVACGFDENLCELNKPEKEMLDKANELYSSSVLVKRIPCEGIYIRVELQNNSVNDSIINNLHKVLHDSTSHHGWQTLLVYDKNGKYLYSHSSNNQKYKQTGD